MKKPEGHPPKSGFAVFKPELHVTDLRVSLDFWCDLVGFDIAYERTSEKFAYLEYENGAQMMLCQRHGKWETGAMAPPFGRGVMFQLRVPSLAPIQTRLNDANYPLYHKERDVWRQLGDRIGGQREIFVLDPDGYLLMIEEPLGERDLNETT